MDAEKQNAAVAVFRDSRWRYERFTSRIEALINELLAAAKIDSHLIEARTKEIQSFTDKIARASKAYRDPLTEITDLCGLRVITYYQDAADAIGRLLEREFVVDQANSVQHASTGAEFGYKSAHFVVALTRERVKLAEWAGFAGMRAEIQVRTVLQHAWAAISHKLQYKREEDVPASLQRKLFRLSALFELADDEFISLRETSASVSTEIVQQVASGNLRLPLDSVSVGRVIATSVAVAKLVAVAAEAGFKFRLEQHLVDDDNSTDISDLIQLARLAGIETAEQLDLTLRRVAKKHAGFFARLMEETGNSPWEASTAFICQLALACAHAGKIGVGHLSLLDYDKDIARRIVDVAKEFSGGLKAEGALDAREHSQVQRK